jgi:hypothetical protein
MIIFPGAKPSFFTDAAAAAIVSATLFNISHTKLYSTNKKLPCHKIPFPSLLEHSKQSPFRSQTERTKNKRQIPTLLSSIPP